MIQSEEKMLAALCHIGALIGLPILVPLIIFLLKKDSDFVRHHAKEALAFQLFIMIALFISALLVIVLIGILLIFLVLIFGFVMTIVGIIKAADGQYYRFPFSTQFAQKF